MGGCVDWDSENFACKRNEILKGAGDGGSSVLALIIFWAVEMLVDDSIRRALSPWVVDVDLNGIGENVLQGDLHFRIFPYRRPEPLLNIAYKQGRICCALG